MRLLAGAGAACIIVILTACIWPGEVHNGGGENRLMRGIVERVIDGDTLCLAGGERIRLAGVDAPPLHARDGSGRSAKEFLENLCPPGTAVFVDPDDLAGRDSHGRLLAVLYVEGAAGCLNVNAELLRSGNARILLVPPTEFNPYTWVSENTTGE